MRRVVSALVFALAAGSAGAAEPVDITIGVVPSLPSAPTYLAIEKGYFRAAGIAATIEPIDSAAKAIPLLASNHIQVVEGGLAVGYFNAVAQGLPVIMALERGSSPVYQKIVLRPDLKGVIKSVADLRGRRVALVAPGSIVVYELGKVLESAGLTLDDVDIKYMPFPAMSTALANGAVDAALMIEPFTATALEQGFAAEWIDADAIVRPQPLALLAYMVNTDWVAANSDAARRLFVALVRGGREYCQAYHHGPGREEVIDALLKYDKTLTRARLEKWPWQARDPNGRFNMASVMDVQDWFFKHKMLDRELPSTRLVDRSYADAAERELGPFMLVNKASPLPGCR